MYALLVSPVLRPAGQTSELANGCRIKESRLLSEFREQDSYLNSDYDSDTSTAGYASGSEAGPSTPTYSGRSSPASFSRRKLTNSLITQGDVLLQAAKGLARRPGGQHPRIRMVLNRLIRPDEGFSDDRIDRTIDRLTAMGITVQLGETPGPPIIACARPALYPTKNIVLDLSVLVALCCDSSHHPLPTSPDDFETRFRSLSLPVPTQNRHEGPAQPRPQLELAKHSNTSKDLCDQLHWEAQHPLVQELKDRLSADSIEDDNRHPQFWITDEVKGRLPGLVDVIGGPEEKRRGRALLQGGNADEFWKGSRWEGKEGPLRHLKIEVLPIDNTPLANAEAGDPSQSGATSPFQASLLATCRGMLALMDSPWPPPAKTKQKPSGHRKAAPTPPVVAVAGDVGCNGLNDREIHPSMDRPENGYAVGETEDRDHADVSTRPIESGPISDQLSAQKDAGKKHTRRLRRSRNPKRLDTVFPANRYPSAHTLRTLIAGAERGWTVLTNNRGAIGKIGREMGISEGLPLALPSAVSAESEKQHEPALLWIVNPSSLSEWRRLEVERENKRVAEEFATMQIS